MRGVWGWIYAAAALPSLAVGILWLAGVLHWSGPNGWMSPVSCLVVGVAYSFIAVRLLLWRERGGDR